MEIDLPVRLRVANADVISRSSGGSWMGDFGGKSHEIWKGSIIHHLQGKNKNLKKQ